MTIDADIYRYVVAEESYADGAMIVEEGRHGDWMYVVLEGRVKLKRRAPQGMINLATLNEGATFGEIAYFKRGKAKRLVSAAADGPVTVGLLDMQRLGAAYNDLSPLLRRLLSNLAQRVEEAVEQLAAFSMKA